MTAREIIKIIKNDGWYYSYSNGGHDYYKHHSKPGKISIPQHKTELKIKTANSILKQAGLK
jgi:predicted RNA binding protein YcfA (HicA-like mRNA interferase family)